ncbi:SDR family NAD(P)-dependent oxidoreductase [Frankia sp. Cr1]|uniref:SDR family NAD(P)-dependent oxidoreductase n=1 Tax=Frankia sp. Cr1 TaxID=3073931 RepID=UPI002AD44F7A|nr:SDR family NAD(P)-dependent oxidoreductase [Frankia sp. Cr1]
MNRRRVGIVTGANRGIGYELARQLAATGVTVVTAARDAAAATATAEQLQGEGLDVHPVHLDITDQASIDTAIVAVIACFGRIDVLVNNAGIAIDARVPAATPDLATAHRTVDTNLFGTWRCCTAVIPHMTAAGYGRIVNLTSHMSLSAQLRAGSPSYRISKAAINTLTRILADELAGTGILINAASPGQVQTRIGPKAASRTPAEAAKGLLWLTDLPADGPTGRLFYEHDELTW